MGSDGAKIGYGSTKRKYGVGGMNEVWNQKYEPGPIRDPGRGSIRSCRYMRAWRHRSAHDYRAGVRPHLQISRTTISEWAIWSSGGAPAKARFSLARATQCAPNSTRNSPFDPAHGAPELPEDSGSCRLPAPVWPMAMHEVEGTSPNSVDNNHLHPQPHISSGGTS